MLGMSNEERITKSQATTFDLSNSDKVTATSMDVMGAGASHNCLKGTTSILGWGALLFTGSSMLLGPIGFGVVGAVGRAGLVTNSTILNATKIGVRYSCGYGGTDLIF